MANEVSKIASKKVKVILLPFFRRVVPISFLLNIFCPEKR